MTQEILKGIHRRSLGINHHGQITAHRGVVVGGAEKPVIIQPSPDWVAIFDDFLGVADTGMLLPNARYNDIWIVGYSDTGQLLPLQGPVATSAVSATNGVFRLTSSATSTQTPAGGAQSLNTPPNWKANQGQAALGHQNSQLPLHFGVRLKTATLAGNTVFAGFTDTGGCEIAAYDTGGGIQTPAADYAGFIWSGEGGATQQAYRFVAGKAGTDQSATTGVTPTANVYDVLEVEISPDGNVATGFINGKAVAQFISAAVTPTVALAAGVWRANTDAAADAIDIDWINVAAPRDTGL